ncbi:hypothetical protein [Trichormus azollae]|uniref:hypothetical protein n=1 Tax=Trichormus azollae TaxID=1164 RepID=UPI00325CE497
MTNPIYVGKPTKSEITIDIVTYCQQVRQILRDGVRDLEYACEEDPITDERNTDFPMSLEALYQDWDEPRLIQVMMRNITPRGVWTEEVPEFADDLLLVCL